MNKIKLFVIGFLYSALFTTVAFAAEGNAVIKGTVPGSQILGEIKFTETEKGLIFEAKFKNVPKTGKLGFHIHEVGSCDDRGKAAGGHYNPMRMPHELLKKDVENRVRGSELENVTIAKDGTGSLSGLLIGFSLSGGKYSVAGKSVILHEKEDDYTQPTGNAGGRIGCGIIEIRE